MEEKKEKVSKKINLKNKKEATKALTKKTTPKTKKTTKKSSTKKNTNKSTTVKKVKVEEKEKELETKKKKTQSTPKETKKTPKEKKESKETKEKKTKKVTPKKSEEEKVKVVLPKEWQEINKNKPKEKGLSQINEKLSGKIKNSIFEEVDEKTFLIKKERQKEKLKKTMLVLLIIIVSLFVVAVLLYKFNDKVREQFTIYDTYTIGEKVKLKDGSLWYVVTDSKNSEKTVKLLSEKIIDINKDSKYDKNDKLKYNSLKVAEYDITNEDSSAKYLNDTYKLELEELVGKIEEISLLTSREFVKIRERMGFGYEWSTENWLAGSSLSEWWIISSQNEKVYAVTKTGTYKLYSPDSTNYVRPTIVIDKSLVEKIEEKNKDKD